jgi:hypothetical protein
MWLKYTGDFSKMVRNTLSASWLILAAINLMQPAGAQVKNAYQLLPDTTQAVVWIPNTDELIGRWDRTQLAKLATAVKPFWDDQRQEIEKRFLDAGWRLNIKPQELSNIAEGQFSIAWIERAGDAQKPFGLALIVDVVEDRKAVDELLNRIDTELIARKAKKRELTYEGESINQYSLARPGELLVQETYYSIVDRQLLSADDEQLIKDLIARAKGKPTATPALETEPNFIAGRQQLVPSQQSQVEYFVRPIGFAKILKAIGGKRRTGNTDILAVLANQGFSEIKCVCGEIQFGSDEYDIQHRGFTLASHPLPKSAAILDFPNKAKSEIPKFVTENVSTLLVGYWNSQEAFWKVEGLVDEMAGQEGVFMEVIKGIKTDPTGPKIDIKQEVLPYFSNDIYSVSDTVNPITTDSHRNLIALRVSEPEKLKAVLRRAMKNEPDTERVEGPDEIWKKVHTSDSGADSTDLGNDFGDFGAPGNAPPAGEPTPWLSSWAIAVHDDYFMFASHVDMIKEAIAQSKSGRESPLVKETNSERMRAALVKVFGDEPNCFWQIIRSDLSYRMQYELFRTGELDQSESWLASLLDRLLQNNAEIKANGVKKIDGQRLPKFEEIAHYLQPSGMVVQTKENGWAFGSLLLAGPAPKPAQESELTGSPQSRVSNAESGEKR